MNTTLPAGVEIAISALFILSGVFVMISALGFWRMKDFFLRMHATALAYTFASWCATLASVVFFSTVEQRLVLHPLLIALMLAVTSPITTVLLARVALFRRRSAGVADTPLPLSAPASKG